jgi:hypothetical protein
MSDDPPASDENPPTSHDETPPSADESSTTDSPPEGPTPTTTTAPDTEQMATDTTPDDEQTTKSTVERYARYLLIAGFALLALIALLRFYFAASTTIDIWIADDYRSLFQAVFNLAVLLVAGAGIGWQVRKMR